MITFSSGAQVRAEDNSQCAALKEIQKLLANAEELNTSEHILRIYYSASKSKS